MEFITNENGFAVEKHDIVTKDGYILGVYRIPGTVNETKPTTSKPAVLIHHALDMDMMEWVFNRPEVAPAFILARAGYDVWLGNNRGNRFSNTHKTLDPKKEEYWEFDWEDMGLRDTPDTTDYILNFTGQDQINYIGHSEGTT